MSSLSIDRNDLKQAMRLAGGYLVNACGPEGRFRYKAHADGQAVKDGYNILRHCGAIYALASYARREPDDVDLSALLRSTQYLQTSALAGVPERPGMAAIRSYPDVDDSVDVETFKLGGAGLGLASFALVEELLPGTTSPKSFQGLVDFLCCMQKPDGSFFTTFMPMNGSLEDGKGSLYYPGEAALGLLIHHELQGNRRAFDAAVRALLYLADSRAEQSKVPEDHWALIATGRLFAMPDFDKDSSDAGRLAEHTEKVANALMERITRFRGQSPVVCGIASRLEGLLAATDILSERNSLLREAVTESINYGIKVILSSQIRQGSLAGGIPHRWRRADSAPEPKDLEVRIDYVQHSLSALLEFDRRFDLLHRVESHAPTDSFIENARASLEECFHLGAGFIVRQQLSEGNFIYERNWTTGTVSSGDNSVRQAGTLWALTLYARATGNSEAATAAGRAIDFFLGHSRLTGSGGRYIVYPGTKSGHTGTIALCALGLVELLRGTSVEEERRIYRQRLGEFVAFLVDARTTTGLWHSRYTHEGEPYDDPSPYFDGECLLALARAARYIDGFDWLKPVVMKSASKGFLHNILLALRKDSDSPVTKGYYQWSTMAYYEIFTSGWPDTGLYGDHILYLADWLIEVHGILKRRRNTAYAFEGLACAYATAVSVGDTERRDKYRSVIDQGLSKLLTWQVGHTLANSYIRAFDPRPEDLGGVQGAAYDGLLRIDTTQHMVHAAMLCLEHVYRRDLGVADSKVLP